MYTAFDIHISRDMIIQIYVSRIQSRLFMLLGKKSLKKKKTKEKEKMLVTSIFFFSHACIHMKNVHYFACIQKRKIFKTLRKKKENSGDQPFLHFSELFSLFSKFHFDLCSIRILQLLSALTILKICFH